VNVGTPLFADESASNMICGLDVSDIRTASEKADGLLTAGVVSVEQSKQLENPDARVAFENVTGDLLEQYADSLQGIKTGDDARNRRYFWEQPCMSRWMPLQSTADHTVNYGGLEYVIDWQSEGADMARLQGASPLGKEEVSRLAR